MADVTSTAMSDLSNILGNTTATTQVAKNSTNTRAGADLDMTDFLTLMCAMFQNQDIDNTASTTDMLNQMVQMSVIQAISDIGSVVTSTSGLNYGASLVGKDVVVGVNDGTGKIKEIEGTVTGTGVLDGQQVIFIGNDTYSLSDILAVGKLPAPKEEGDNSGESGGTDTDQKPDATTGEDN